MHAVYDSFYQFVSTVFSASLTLYLISAEGFEESQNQSQDIQLLDAVLKLLPDPYWKIWQQRVVETVQEMGLDQLQGQEVASFDSLVIDHLNAVKVKATRTLSSIIRLRRMWRYNDFECVRVHLYRFLYMSDFWDFRF